MFFSNRWKFIIFVTQSILTGFTVGITNGIPDNFNSKIKPSYFEYNGTMSTMPENYQLRKSLQVDGGISAPSKLDPSYTSTSTSTIHSSTFPQKKGKADARNGISVDKTPPDLQFGLAFTVPFVSLSTDRLLSTVSGHRGYNSLSDIMSILKLNVGGLVLAAVVGLAALVFVPAVFAGKGNGLGGLQNIFNGNFMPGFLEHIVPGLGQLGLNKPLGFGQYDNSVYQDPYGNNAPYGNNLPYGNGINRKDNDGRSRSLNDNQNNGTNTFGQLTNIVSEYIGQAQSCALYTMCKRGRDEKRTASPESNLGGRGGRKSKLTTLDHAIEVIHGVSDDIPGLESLKEAYNVGQSELIDCSEKYKDCDIANSAQITNYINNIGEFIFSK